MDHSRPGGFLCWDAPGGTEPWMEAPDVGSLQARLFALRRTGECGARERAELAPQALARSAALFRARLEQDSTAEQVAADAAMHVSAVREAAHNLEELLGEEKLRTYADFRLSRRRDGRRLVCPVPPALVFHLTAGNLFLSGIESLAYAALCGASSLVRSASHGSKALLLWQRCLREVSPQVGSAVAVARWSRDRTELTQLACSAADVVVAFGSDRSVSAIRALTPPPARFLPHGTRFSFALLGPETWKKAPHELRQIAEALAYDFSVYDQQGCLSPRTAFLVGEEDPAVFEEFAELLSRAMGALAERLPRAPLSLEESAALARARDEVAVEAVCSGQEPASTPSRVISRRQDPFLVTLRSCGGYRPGPVGRYADVRVARNSLEVLETLLPYRGKISTLGVQDAPWVEEWLAPLQLSRICRLGKMQKPELGWTHDGRESLSDLLTLAEIERQDF